MKYSRDFFESLDPSELFIVEWLLKRCGTDFERSQSFCPCIDTPIIPEGWKFRKSPEETSVEDRWVQWWGLYEWVASWAQAMGMLETGKEGIIGQVLCGTYRWKQHGSKGGCIWSHYEWEFVHKDTEKNKKKITKPSECHYSVGSNLNDSQCIFVDNKGCECIITLEKLDHQNMEIPIMWKVLMRTWIPL